MIFPAVPKLPTLALPVTDRAPPVTRFPPVTFPVATTRPAVPKLPTLALPVTARVDVVKSPVAALKEMLALDASA